MNHYRIMMQLLTAGALAAGLTGCAKSAGPAILATPVVTTPVGTPGTQADWHGATGLTDLSPGPIVQFEQSCARCHGPQGSFYGNEFARLDLPELRNMVLQMMQGPAGLLPTTEQVDAMVAYHVGLRNQGLFVVIDNAAAFAAGQQPDLRGEVTPGSTVEVQTSQEVRPAQVQDITWTLPGAPQPPFTVVATRNGRQATIDFPLRQWSARPAAPDLP